MPGPREEEGKKRQDVATLLATGNADRHCPILHLLCFVLIHPGALYSTSVPLLCPTFYYPSWRLVGQRSFSRTQRSSNPLKQSWIRMRPPVNVC